MIKVINGWISFSCSFSVNRSQTVLLLVWTCLQFLYDFHHLSSYVWYECWWLWLTERESISLTLQLSEAPSHHLSLSFHSLICSCCVLCFLPSSVSLHYYAECYTSIIMHPFQAFLAKTGLCLPTSCY